MDSDRQGRAGVRVELVDRVVAVASKGEQAMADIVGIVQSQLPSGLYRVKLETGQLITAHIADRVDRNFVRVLVGDRVRLELSPVDRGRGRIVEKLA